MSGQVKVVSLNCLKCGATLEISQSVTQFSCAYCGAAQTVQRGSGIVSLSLVTEAIEKVRVGTDKTAAELAVVRIRKEIEGYEAERIIAVVALENAKKSTDYEKAGCLAYLTIPAIALWAYLCVKANSDSVGLFVMITALVVGLVIWLRALYAKGQNRLYAHAEQKHKDELERLNNRTADAESRLAEQVRIVNS